MSTDEDVVENYLDQLLALLRGQPRAVRRMLAETEEHLHAAIDEGTRCGVPTHDAAVAAVDRFGAAAQVAQAWNASTPAEPLAMFARRVVGKVVPLAAVGLIAIGLSGVVARVMTALWGRTFMFADATGTTYPESACRHWLSLHPAARTCTTAYLAESEADGLLLRYSLGVVGVLLLAALVLLRHRRGMPLVDHVPVFTSLIGTVAFLVITLGLLGLGVEAVRTAGSHGAGQWLSGAVISLPLACGYGLTLLRSARRSNAILD